MAHYSHKLLQVRACKLNAVNAFSIIVRDAIKSAEIELKQQHFKFAPKCSS